MSYTQAVIDASIAVKWFSDEEGSESARKLFVQSEDGVITLHAPELLFCEVGNALWKGKRFDTERIDAALGILFDSRIRYTGLSRAIFPSAVRFMTAHNLTFYDAIYGALAHTLRIPLLTANPKDHGRIKEIRVVGIDKFLGT